MVDQGEQDLQREIQQFQDKLAILEERQHGVRQRQDTIDNLALDTLLKMDLLLAKMKTVQSVCKVVVVQGISQKIAPFLKTRLKILPVLTREHYTSLLHWV
jgi:hypothetical protein